MNITNENIELLAQLFDEKLRGIHVKMDAEFTVLNVELKQIKEQVIKTNSRVNHLEDDVQKIEKDAVIHVTECPAIEKIEKLNEELIEYKVFKKYPKIAVGVIAVSCLLFLASIWLVVDKVETKVNTNIEQTEHNTNEITKLDSLNTK